MPARALAPKASRSTHRPAVRGRDAHLVWPIVALGFAPPLVVLAGVAATAVGRVGDAPAALAWAVAPAAAAALLTAASAWWTLVALRRASTAPAPDEPRVGPHAAAPGTCGDDDAASIELDHKVRNALQIVESLVSLELRRAGPTGGRAALLRLQTRLNSLSLVHRRISAVDASAMVRLDLITAEIAGHVFAGHAPDAATVKPRMTLDAVFAASGRAAAFALFVNEALVNARDHRDRAQADRPVEVSLQDLGDGACLLSIRNAADATDAAVADDGAIGARLMASCADQLGAALSTKRSGGAYEVRLSMPPRSSP